MAGTFNGKILAQGQLAAAQATIYVTPADTKAYVRGFSLAHVAGATQTCEVWLKQSGGTARKWRRVVLRLNEFAELIDPGVVVLDEGDEILANASDAASVDFNILGAEET